MSVYTWVVVLGGLFFVKGAPSEGSDGNIDPSSLFDLALVTQINAFITLDSLITNLISIDVANPFLIPLVIQQITSSAGLNGTTYATFNHKFSPPFVINPFQTANSGNISHVNLTQGGLRSLHIIPLGILDINSDVTFLEVDPILVKLKQSGVPTKYHLDF